MTKLAHVFPDVELAQGFNRLRAWADEFIAGISAVPDEHIVEIARGANEMETQGFRIRGACAAELKRRVRERSVGDEAKLGEAMAGLARDVGVHVQTLIDDCRIFEKFGDEIIVNNNLPREVYRLAMTAKDPHAAVETYAARKAEDERYSTLDFRRDMSDMNKGEEPRPEAVSDEDTREVTWELTREVLREVHQLSTALACDHELAVSYAVRYAAKALREGYDIRSRI